MALRLLSPDRCHPVLAGGAGQGSGSFGTRPRLRGAAGVLDVLADEPIMAGQGDACRPQPGNGGMRLCPTPRCGLAAGRAPGAVIRSEFPRLPAAGAWGGSRAGSGINQRRGRAAGGGGPDLRAITNCPCPGLHTRPLARGCGRPVTLPARRAARRRRR